MTYHKPRGYHWLRIIINLVKPKLSMQNIGIIGAGFSGTMTAIQLIVHQKEELTIHLIDNKQNFNKGVAYNPYSDKHLLNVVAAKMSAFSNEPDHFLNWVMQQPDFINKERSFVAQTFLPRSIYGKYMTELFDHYKQVAQQKGIQLTMHYTLVKDLNTNPEGIELNLTNGSTLNLNQCVIATGNQLPRNPRLQDTEIYKSPHYFQNPWMADSVKNIQNTRPILIIGNGLTMVDTVLSLLEEGYNGKIYTLSPNGFNILPHRHNGLKYNALTDELQEKMTLTDLFTLTKKHIQAVRTYGVSAEPVIDSLRPYSQKIWRSFTESEKRVFMNRIRHLWGVARHRIPLNSYDKLQQMRINSKLHVISGEIRAMEEIEGHIEVAFINKRKNTIECIGVSRVINCTGPESNIQLLQNSFLTSCLRKGIITQDSLKLGINACPETFHIYNAESKLQESLFTMGSTLRGILWESTAVGELREQAALLAKQLISAHSNVQT